MKAKQQKILVTILVVALSAFAIFWLFLEQPSSGQQVVAESIEIKDLTKGYTLEPDFVQTKTLIWLSAIPVSGTNFQTGNSYQQSLWVWRNPEGDIDYVATIWGPDESGTGYYIELARLCSRKMQITYPGNVIILDEITDWSTDKHLGYSVVQMAVIE